MSKRDRERARERKYKEYKTARKRVLSLKQMASQTTSYTKLFSLKRVFVCVREKERVCALTLLTAKACALLLNHRLL